jgi:pyruvate formate lyase activating enzyme
MRMSGSRPLPIKGFLETSFLDWPGKIVSVVFLPSCGFRCPYCQNVSLILNPELLPTIPLASVLTRIQEFEGWIDGVCITGGEPTLHRELPDLVRRFKEKNLLVKLDTNGSNPGLVKELLAARLVDCVALDVKAPLDELAYSRLIGVPADLGALRETIAVMKDCNVETFFRTTCVPGLLTEEDIHRIAAALHPKRLVVQQFRPEHTLDPALHQTVPWPQERLDQLQAALDERVGADRG